MPEKVGYAMSKNIEGPWQFKGIINDVPENCITNRPCIINFKNQTYFIYHNGALRMAEVTGDPYALIIYSTMLMIRLKKSR